ncbi:hypothetical protein D3C72_1773100 [compost metagenome]
MAAQGLRDIGVGLGQLDQQLDQLRQRGTGAGVFARHAHGTESGLLEPADGLVGQAAGALALQRAFGDAGEDRTEPGGERLVVGAGGNLGKMLLGGHRGSPWLAADPVPGAISVPFGKSLLYQLVEYCLPSLPAVAGRASCWAVVARRTAALETHPGGRRARLLAQRQSFNRLLFTEHPDLSV